MSSTWKYISYVAASVAIFCLGVIVGVKSTEQRFFPIIEEGEIKVADTIMRRMEYRLGLSDEQREKIRPVVEKFSEKAAAVRQTIRPQMEKELVITLDQVMPHLNESQQRKMKLFQKRIQALVPKSEEDSSEDSEGTQTEEASNPR